MKASRKPLTFEEDRQPALKAKPVEAKPVEQAQQIGARVPASLYRQLKAHAALEGVTVAALVEQAITEFLENHTQQ